MEIKTRLSRHNKFISAENIIRVYVCVCVCDHFCYFQYKTYGKMFDN